MNSSKHFYFKANLILLANVEITAHVCMYVYNNERFINMKISGFVMPPSHTTIPVMVWYGDEILTTIISSEYRLFPHVASYYYCCFCVFLLLLCCSSRSLALRMAVMDEIAEAAYMSVLAETHLYLSFVLLVLTAFLSSGWNQELNLGWLAVFAALFAVISCSWLVTDFIFALVREYSKLEYYWPHTMCSPHRKTLFRSVFSDWVTSGNQAGAPR